MNQYRYLNRELADFQAGFRKGKGARDRIESIHWIIEKAREFQKNIYFCFIGYAKTFEYVDHNNVEKFSRGGNTRSPYILPKKSVCRSRRNRTRHGTTNWFQIGKGVH